MTNARDNYELLIQKLDEFIRRFYLNSLIRGVLYTLAFILALFITLNVLEYFFYFPQAVRKILFFGFIGASGAAVYWWIALPLLHYARLGKIISHDMAAKIIGQHFSEVNDKLLNILQLKHQYDARTNEELIRASINQKIDNIKLVPFKAAINLKQNRKYVKYALAPLLVLVFILFSAPNIIKDGTKRLFYNNIYFEKEAPFKFVVVNDKLEAMQYEDLHLEVKIEGSALPSEVYIQADNYLYKLDKNSASSFSYKFSNLQKDVKFYLNANGFRSQEYDITVLPKPLIVSFDVALEYPAYTGKQKETLRNIGDLIIPEGTKVNWKFFSKNTDEISMNFIQSSLSAKQSGKDVFTAASAFRENTTYTIKVSNQNVKDADSITYNISVLADQYPTIKVEQYEDSTNTKFLYYMGEVADDYGLRNLYFKYNIEKADAERRAREEQKTVSLQLPSGSKYSRFSHYWDVSELQLQPGDKLTYFFEIWDNDGINGSKATRSSLMAYQMPTKQEFEALTEKSNEEIKDQLASSMDEARKIREEVEAIKDKLIQKKNMDWEDKKAIQDLLEKQKSLEEKMKQMQENYEKNISQQQEYKQVSEQVLEKQQKLQDLFDKLMSEEMKKMFEQLENLMDQLNKEMTLDQLNEMEMTDEQLEKELDRLLSLFKKIRDGAKAFRNS